MADNAPSPHGLAALAVSASLLEALLRRGAIDRATVEAILKEATTYAQALCIDCSPEVERETLRIVGLIGTPEEPVVEAASATAAIADER
ncbi:hypothetical protein SAMN02990966_05975 [Rhodospirillales bacterium URHD0017]|nr:hypothetical protein SAMN02990966_05975 [Rhodospirillales bacterium URHD0017]